MGADLYCIDNFYGYKIIIPKGTPFKKVFKQIANISDDSIEEPFNIFAVLSEFHSRMEGMSKEETLDTYSGSDIIIGFETEDDLSKMVEYADKLKKFITDNPVLTGIQLSKAPGFFSGIETYNDLLNLLINEKDDDEEDDDEEDDDEEDDDGDSEDDDDT